MKNNKGFSLVELIVVIAIMAILAAIAIPTFATFITRANEASDKDFANGIEYAVNIALAGEAKEAEAIKVQVTNKKVTALTVKIKGVDDELVVIGTDADEEDKIVADIVAVIDDTYELKTTKDFTEGLVAVDFAPFVTANDTPAGETP